MPQRHGTWLVGVVLWAVITMALLGRLPDARAQPGPGNAVGSDAEVLRRWISAVPVSLELRDADLKTILRTLGQQFDLNLLVHEGVKGQVTVSFRNVPLRDVFEALASTGGLAIVPAPGRIIEILPLKSHEGRLKERAAVAAEVVKVEAPPPPALVTQRIDIQHAYDPRKAISTVGKEIGAGEERKDLTELVVILRKRLSGRPGSDISIISRANALLVTDTPEKVEEIVSLLQVIDVPSPTVGIEAKIAEISSQGLEDLGVQWGGVGKIGRSGDFTLGGGSTGGTTGTPPTTPQSGGVGLSGSNFIVNFPATLPLTSGFSFAFTLGKQATRILDFQISALQQKGKARLLASPRVTTPNHERALIESGREIPFLTQSIAAGVQTFTVQFKRASIELEVTPHIIGTHPPHAIALDVIVARKEADFSTAVGGNPSLISRTLFTRAVVQEGEAAVIGGLLTDDNSETISQVPFLGDIPVLGWFFKERRLADNRLQLMVFISPSILPTPLAGAVAPLPSRQP